MSLRSEITRTEGLVPSANRARQNINNAFLRHGGSTVENFAEVAENIDMTIRKVLANYKKVAILDNPWKVESVDAGSEINFNINFNKYDFMPRYTILLFRIWRRSPYQDGKTEYAYISSNISCNIGRQNFGTAFMLDSWDLDIVNKRIQIKGRNISNYPYGIKLFQVIAIE